jgi:hypothetical protein
MPRNYAEHNLIDFQKSFPDDESCAKHLAEQRWPDGFDGKAAKDKNLSHCRIFLRDPKAAGRVMPWVHWIIANTKNVIRGTHRGVSKKDLQAYLSEIAYRFNCRFWERELFDRLIQACVCAETITYEKLVHPNAEPNKH